MSHENDDREGQKPYKTYKARRPRRTAVDDQLAGASTPRDAHPRADEQNRPRDDAMAAQQYPQRSDKAYRTYGPAPDSGKARAPRGGPSGLPPARRRRRLRWWHIPVGVLAVLLIAGIVGTVLAWPGYNRFDRAVDHANNRLDKKARAELSPDDGWILRNGTTLLLLGLDQSNLTTAHSDTIMLMHFDPKTHTVNQLSIPRDTKVEIPGYGTNKINQAMWAGGPALALQTVKQYTGIPINHVMVVDFRGFPRMVNAVGGVDMRVPKTIETTAGGRGRVVVFKEGMYHFDGKYAMIYVRIRLADDDFHRAARQQAFLQALQKQLVKPTNIPKLPDIGRRFMSGVATDLTTKQLIELAYLKWRADGGKKIVMVGPTGYEGGVAYVFPPDEAEREKMIRRFLNN